MNLNYALPERDRAAALQAVGDIRYAVPADIALEGRSVDGYFVVGPDRWAYVQDGAVRECLAIRDGKAFALVPLVGNAVLEAEYDGGKRILVRVSMRHVARYAYIAKILNDIAADEPVRIYNDEAERTCTRCGGPLVHGTRVCPRCMSKAAALKRLFGVSKAHGGLLAVSFLLLLVISGVALLGPYFQRLLVDSALQPPEGQSADVSVFFLAIFGMLAALLVHDLLTIVRGRFMVRVSSSIAADLRRLVFDNIQRLSLGFLTSQRAGEIMNRVSSDTDRIRNLIQEIFTSAIHQFIMLTAVSFLLFRIDGLLALLVILPAPLVVYLQYAVWRKVLRKLIHRQWRIHDKANSYLHDVLGGIRVVKAFGQEQREIRRFREYNSEFAAASLYTEKVYSVLAPLSNYLMRAGMYFVLLLGGYMVLGGRLSLGELVQFTGYAAMIYGPLAWLMNMPRWLANAAISIDRVFSLIDEEPEVVDASAAVRPQLRGDISIRDVTFGYKSYEPVLKNIRLDIRRGEMIGLVGHSGAGKSTLLNLITRFYDVNEGAVLIDGVDIRSMRQEALRSQIGVVLQETLLFRGSILENIRYAKPEATLEEVIQAAYIANAHDFIVRLPDGYDTVLEENGNNLSGGERQRIAIARAVLHNPRIILLDEATASLDMDAEAAIQEALLRLAKDRTTIAIAHRLATLRHADRLVVFEKGEIAEIGTHNELLEKKGIYYGLVMAQRDLTKPKEERVAQAAL